MGFLGPHTGIDLAERQDRATQAPLLAEFRQQIRYLWLSPEMIDDDAGVEKEVRQDPISFAATLLLVLSAADTRYLPRVLPKIPQFVRGQPE